MSAPRPVEAEGRSESVEHVAAEGAGPMRVPSPVMPEHWRRSRDPLRSRDLDAELASRQLRGARRQSSAEPTRQRSHKKSRRSPIRMHDSKHLPSWRQQATNWRHTSPAKQDHGAYHADHRSKRAGSRGRPNRESRPLRPTFLMLLRSRRAIGRPLETPGWPVAAGGRCGRPRRSRADSPGQERG